MEPGHYHVVGVAGVGMSAVAQALLGHGCRVSGSDRFLDRGDRLEVLDRLEQAGVKLVPQTGEGIHPDTAAIVVSTAIEPDNPDVVRAAAAGVPTVHRAAMLARLAAGHDCTAVTGTAGKTTVTGMAGYILEQCGRDPTVVNGGEVVNWQADDRVGNVRMGAGGPWILEADESDRSLLAFSPRVALITNISKDHFELEEVIGLFREFADRVRGPVLCGPGVRDVLGLGRAVEIEGRISATGSGWAVELEGTPLPVPGIGRHNAENALAALNLCRELGVPAPDAGSALQTFRGIGRRLEPVGVREGVRIFDDYGHNPVKIAAAWRAAAERPGRVIGVWRPHGYGPLRLMFDELAEAFTSVCRQQDLLLLLPVFYAGGTASADVSSDDLADRLRASGIDARTAPDADAVLRTVREASRAGDTVLVMGARDPGLPRLARALAAP